jgi:DNA-directed RNA polymerase subunit RPC12/RpoP
MLDALSLCPRCGSDRLIPLSFPEDEATEEVQEQPVLKCAICGYRIYEPEITTQDTRQADE